MKNKNQNLLYIFSILFLAIGFACIHIHHVSTLFENDGHFSHLSNLEREMKFRTEMGFYYYYYKKIVQAPSFDQGLREIMQDNQTEYPDAINALERFNLYPEIILGGLFKIFDTVTEAFEIPTKECWEVSRGPSLPPVNACEGLGDPMYFYLEFVWYCAGLSKAVLFIYAVILSDSCCGGLLAVLSFLYNHSHCTRVQWSPPLRESFAYPFCLLQMLSVTFYLKNLNCESHSNLNKFLKLWLLTSLTAISLVLWQFSQFVIATQTISVLLIYCFSVISKQTLLIIVFSQMVCLETGLLQAAIMLFGNIFLFQSILFSLLLATTIVVIGLEERIQYPSIKGISVLIAIAFTTVIFKTKISQFFGSHDSHIFDLLASKITDYKNFHTMLYTCSPEFDFLPFSTIVELTITGLIPAVALVLCLLAYKWRRNFIAFFYKPDSSESIKPIEPEVAYNVLQLGAFTIMAIFIMRLKLFWSPHLCLMTSLIMSSKYMAAKTNLKYFILVTLIAIMSYHGIDNLIKQRNIIGEYVNIQFEEVLTWINSETLPTDVFAGPMSIMANVLLSTGRRIVNHPHYEHQKMRNRTMKVYSIFSRQSPKQVYSTLLNMGVDYVILDEAWCFPRNRENCSMVDLWDLTDLENRNSESLCPKLFDGNPSPFIRAFSNKVFVILSLKTRQFIEITPLQKY